MKIKVDLKPCPFCGGIPEVKQFANPKNFYTVQCPECYCRTDGFSTNRTSGSDKENIQANVDAWNRRVNEDLEEEPGNEYRNYTESR